MPEAVLSPFRAWENFYVIVGSSAGALTGLQFVVIVLLAESRQRRSSREIAAFGTPTIVHFCAVLLLAAILSAPWRALSTASLCLGIAGAAGVVYVSLIVLRARRQTGYRPVLEDWLGHGIFPAAAYAAVVVGALMLRQETHVALFLLAAASLMLLFTGIHNAWDTVTYIAIEHFGKPG